MKKYICDTCGYVYDPEVGVLITAYSPEQHLRTFQKIGFALYAELVRTNSQ